MKGEGEGVEEDITHYKNLSREVYLFLSDVRLLPALLVTGQRSEHFLRSLLRGCHFTPLLSGSFRVLEGSTVFKDVSHLSKQHQWMEKWYVSYEFRMTPVYSSTGIVNKSVFVRNKQGFILQNAKNMKVGLQVIM